MKVLFIVQKFTRSVGASEDLVTAAAARLSTTGPAPAIWFNFAPPEDDPRIARLLQSGCPVLHDPQRSLARRVLDRLDTSGRTRRDLEGLRRIVVDTAPDLVVVNQGGNSDAWAEMLLLRELGVPYLVLCHAAVDWSWPTSGFAATLRDALLGARLVCFVSRENCELTESQIGTRLPHTAVVRNPCKFTEPRETPWPAESEGYRLACVARLDSRMKGQDLILQALSRPRWQDRALSVTFFGDGPDLGRLESLAASLGIKERCRFAGHVSDISAIWESHHGFIQPSRNEGFGLSLLEACFCGRIAIATPFPAAREFVVDGESGFLAANPSPDAVDAALERAWAARAQWRAMGQRAIEIVRDYPRDPVDDFVSILAGYAQPATGSEP